VVIAASFCSCPRRRRRCVNRRGAAIVETALVLPLMLLFLFGIMEYGRYFLCVQVVTNAAREGCRYAVTHTQPVTLGGTTTGNATSDVTNQVTKFLAGQQLSSQSVQVYQSDSQGNNLGVWNGATPGQYVCVQITGSFQITVPKLLSFPSGVPVQSIVVMICEGN
jgi:Flp pilus assembly protein TadG